MRKHGIGRGVNKREWKGVNGECMILNWRGEERGGEGGENTECGILNAWRGEERREY
jgi:hypothetical protein